MAELDFIGRSRNMLTLIDYLKYFWPHRNTKSGLLLLCVSGAFVWYQYVLPHYESHKEFILISLLVILICLCVPWLFWSGRFLLPIKKFSIIFCLKANDPKSIKHIRNAILILKNMLDSVGLLEKFRIRLIGTDIISDRKRAHNYRKRFNIDVIIWGDVIAGAKEEKEVSNFKLFFTYKIPIHTNIEHFAKIFRSDINIALVHRDWNIYEINSLTDTEKVSANLSEIIMFVCGLIYCQYREYAEDSIVILEQLFALLSKQAKDDKAIVNGNAKTLELSASLLRQGRVLAILLNVYKNLGIYFADIYEYPKARFYLEKYFFYEKKDIDALSALAVCAFYLNDMEAAKTHTNEICAIDNQNEICLVNRGFFAISEKNYASAFHFYKQISKRGKVIKKEVVTKVISFLDERKSENLREIAYDFAIGIMNYFHCDKNTGEKDLSKFRDKAKNKAEYVEMFNFVNDEILGGKKRRNHKRKR